MKDKEIVYFPKELQNTDSSKEGVKRYCPNCKKQTLHEKVLYNNDNTAVGEVWVCLTCGEIVDWVEGL